MVTRACHLSAHVVGGEAEAESLEVCGPAGLTDTWANRRLPQTGWKVRTHTEVVLWTPHVSWHVCAYTHTWTHTHILSLKMPRALEQQACDLSWADPGSNGLWGHLEASLQFRSLNALLAKTRSFKVYLSSTLLSLLARGPVLECVIISLCHWILTNHFLSLLNLIPRTRDGFFCIPWSSSKPTHPCSGSMCGLKSSQKERVKSKVLFQKQKTIG